MFKKFLEDESGAQVVETPWSSPSSPSRWSSQCNRWRLARALATSLLAYPFVSTAETAP